MIPSESGPATPEVQPLPSCLLGSDGDCRPVGEAAPGEPLEDEGALHGVVAIEVSREVIARFAGTPKLDELPERRPEIVFDRGPRFRDGDDDVASLRTPSREQSPDRWPRGPEAVS